MALKDKYITISEASKELRVTRQTISRWVKTGKFKAVEKVGRETLIPRDEIEKLRYERSEYGMDRLFRLFATRTLNYIRRKFHYHKGDHIDWFARPGKPADTQCFIVTKRDGNIDIVTLSLEHVKMKDGTGGIMVKKALQEQFAKVDEQTFYREKSKEEENLKE